MMKKTKQTQGHGISTLDFNITLVICFHSIYQKYNISESIKFKKINEIYIISHNSYKFENYFKTLIFFFIYTKMNREKCSKNYH